jgi:hypothetical protein
MHDVLEKYIASLEMPLLLASNGSIQLHRTGNYNTTHPRLRDEARVPRDVK